MKPTKDNRNELTISARTESGKCSLDVGLDHLSTAQRQFIFNSLAATHKGGSIGFGAKTQENGSIVLEITLNGPNLKKPTVRTVKEITH